jgi:hypothetical protein
MRDGASVVRMLVVTASIRMDAATMFAAANVQCSPGVAAGGSALPFPSAPQLGQSFIGTGKQALRSNRKAAWHSAWPERCHCARGCG